MNAMPGMDANWGRADFGTTKEALKVYFGNLTLHSVSSHAQP
jgi:hypothetical protein